jgi:hypothetical protein
MDLKEIGRGGMPKFHLLRAGSIGGHFERSNGLSISVKGCTFLDK